MRRLWWLTALAAVVCAWNADVALGQSDARIAYLKPQYLSPAELSRVLGVREIEGRGVLEWPHGEGTRGVEIRRNDAANLLMVMGAPDDVAAVEAMARAADVPPRQIAIEARIIEIDEDKALDAGIDWPSLRTDFNGHGSWERLHSKTRDESPYTTNTFKQTQRRGQLSGDARVDLFDAIHVLDEKGAATIRNAPRILTLNNRRATILDGQRVTYVTRYSSFTNLFETDTLDAGLTLSVLPSLGESGYLTLDVRAELTSVTGNISGSPVKDGQIVENTVIVKDGETVLLGGFLRTVEMRSRRRFPLLGWVLPFLFSRETSSKSRRESFVAVTPHVVDLAASVEPKTKETLEGR